MVSLNSIEVEVFEAISHLRYLSTEQIQRLWFPERAQCDVARRLRKLRTAEFLSSVVRGGVGRKVTLWRLAKGGLEQLRLLRSGEYRWYRDVRPLFLEHLVETNKVWAYLAASGPVWSDLPFAWRGSHRAQMPFSSVVGGSRGRRVLSADAIIEPIDTSHRVFLELDRSTESLKERRGQRSIHGKLKAYRAAMVLPRPGGRRPSYEVTYSDRRKPLVLFVLSRDPQRRRLAAIRHAAKDIVPELDVRCLHLTDVPGIRAAVLEDSQRHAHRGRGPRAALDVAAFVAVCAPFYREMITALRGAGVNASTDAQLRELQRRLRTVLADPPEKLDSACLALCSRFAARATHALEQSTARNAWPRPLLQAEERLRRVLGSDGTHAPNRGIVSGGRA